MAIVLKNLATKGLSGMLGDTLVFRNIGGRTIVASAPTTTSNHEPTEGQKAHQKLFQKAVLYAKSQMGDPATKAAYEAKAQGSEKLSAYNIAVADFFNAPDIEEIDMSGYTGAVGDKIRVSAIDDFMVAEVGVEIYNSDGSLVESGKAVQDSNAVDWVYTATAANGDLSGDKVVIKASDIPGNISEKEEVL
jgi:hypothetical protein